YVRQRVLDLAQIVWCKVDIYRAEVLFQAMQLRRPWNRHDPRFLREQPRNGDLRPRHFLPRGDFAEHIDQRLVRLSRFRREARNYISKILTVELRLLVDRSREKAFA